MNEAAADPHVAEQQNRPKYYKILGASGSPRMAYFSWWEWPPIGEWTHEIPQHELRPCKSGFHVAELADITKWLEYGTHLYEVEVQGEAWRHQGSKTVVSKARLIKNLGFVGSSIRRSLILLATGDLLNLGIKPPGLLGGLRRLDFEMESHIEPRAALEFIPSLRERWGRHTLNLLKRMRDQGTI